MRDCWSLGFRSGACIVSRRASSPARTCTFSESFSSAISLNNSRMRCSCAGGGFKGVGLKGIGILSGIRLNCWAGGPEKYWIRKVGFIVPSLQMRRAGSAGDRTGIQALSIFAAGRHGRAGQPDGSRIDLPASVHEILVRVVEKMQEGKAIAVMPLMEELSTQAADDLLGVSRQFFVRECEAHKLPFHYTGTHRRVLHELHEQVPR